MMYAYRYVFSLECILSMLFGFHWNVFNIHIQMLSDYTSIYFVEIKWHEQNIDH